MSYQLSVTTSFRAEHALVLKGQSEPVHAHQWQVTAVVSGNDLDDDGLLWDFHDLKSSMRDIVAPLENTNLNQVPPFDTDNPSAELVARHIARCMATRLPPGLALESLSVSEAPGCVATYRPD